MHSAVFSVDQTPENICKRLYQAQTVSCDSPNGADFANYGILRSMQGLNGFDIVESHETVWAWYNRLQMFSGV